LSPTNKWQAAHDRQAAGPHSGHLRRTLLTQFAQCGVCGNPLRAVTRSHGKERAQFSGCSGYHERGKAVCPNRADNPLADGDDIVIAAVLDDILGACMVNTAIDEGRNGCFSPRLPRRVRAAFDANWHN
jgi:hypothetical protein